MPPVVLELIKDIVVHKKEKKIPEGLENWRGDVRIPKLDKWIGRLGQRRQQSSMLIPFRDTSFLIEISRNRAWAGANNDESPTWVGIRVFGCHWEESLNYQKPYESKKDWGANHNHVWGGSEATAEDNFKGFVRYVLEILDALEKGSTKKEEE
jgi:hypothetical protein